jgi:hypothetical protein
LDKAVKFCEKHGLTFYGVNNDFEGEKFYNTCSEKIYVDIYIYDRNLPGISEWGKIYELIIETGKKQK